MTHAEIAAALAAIKHELERSITIVRRIIDRDGKVINTIRQTVRLPKEKE
jgi:predicted protein tyrosine phosphatase